MINSCEKGEHKWEFWSEEHGETEYHCKACGEVMVQASDHHGC